MLITNPMKRLTILACVCLALAPACGREEGVATIGGKVVSKGEFEAFLKLKRIDGKDAGRRSRALSEYVQRTALARAIEDEKLLDAAQTKAELEEFKKEMLISRYFDKYLDDRVSDDALRNYYNAHAKQYEERKVHVAHILVRTNRAMSDEERAAKLTRAQEAYSRVNGGEEFAAVAKSLSEDRLSAEKGGDVGWLKSGSVDPKFSEVAFKLKPGEVSQPFLSQFGYHVVKHLDGPTTVKQPFESVVGDIRHQLRAEAKDAEMKRLEGKLAVEIPGVSKTPNAQAQAKK